MNGATVHFRVIGDFVSSDELRRLFLSKDRASGILTEAARIAVQPTQKDVSFTSEPESTPKAYPMTWFAENDMTDGDKPFIPLILCDERTSIQRKGVFCPYEFVVERKDLLPRVDDKGELVGKPEEILASRLRVLAELYGDGKTNFKEALRDWFAGAFRRYLLLDATTHGTSEFVDLERVKEGKDPILMALAELPCEKKDYPYDKIELCCFGPISKDEIEEKKRRMNVIDNAFKHAELIHGRFVGAGQPSASNDSMLWFKPLAELVFDDYFSKWDNNARELEGVNRSMVRALGLETPEKRFEALCAIYYDGERQAVQSTNDENAFRKIPVKDGEKISGFFSIVPRNHKERLPVAFGDRAKYVTPSGKLNLLLIDDNIDQSPFYYLAKSDKPKCDGSSINFSLTISNDDWKLLRDLFNVQTMPVDEKDGNIFIHAVKRFREMQGAGLTYDLILVDLCLGDNSHEADLAGYRMIQIVKDFFPGTPVVVYSRFSDMEHIARAFFSGAKWFLVKGEEAKLPRHVLKLLKQVGWHREWQAIERGANAPVWHGDEGSAFFRKVKRTDEWGYLIYKSLEHLPGRDITVREMSGGLSSAVTLKATKGVWLEGAPLQTPSVIKIDTSYNTMMEFERYNRMIRPYIANEAGRVERPERVLDRTYSSIVYTFAGKQDAAHELETMGAMLDDDIGCQTACDFETYRYALTCIFDEILPRIHQVSPELECGDVGKLDLQKTDIGDVFPNADDRRSEDLRRTSFPNYYFREFSPSEFWKSYMLRLQPWGRIRIDHTTFDGEANRLFMPQEAIDLDREEPKQKEAINSDREESKQKRLIFHDVMIDPLPSKVERAGRYVIEAYTEDRKLVWLEGDVCDFVARFRKRVAPGTSLWLKKPDNAMSSGKTKSEEDKDSSAWKTLEDLDAGRLDERRKWLEAVFARKKTEDSDAQKIFINAIAALMGIGGIDKALEFYTKLLDELLKLAKDAVGGKAKQWEMKCPVGIVHGDLNVKNIMLESRKHPPKENDPDVTKTVSDVWLIDFARTRRDLIAHDFNVFFTSVLSELFHERLIGKDGTIRSAGQESYWENLMPRFKEIVSAAVSPCSKSERGIPDSIQGDRRFTLLYRILRRTHDAAIAASVSQNMYLLTTALSCLYTLKIFLKKGQVQVAAGQFAAAWICYDMLCKNLDRTNEMAVYKIAMKQTGQAQKVAEPTNAATSPSEHQERNM